MKYIQAVFECDPNTEVVRDILADALAKTGFESFLSSDNGLDAFAPFPSYSKESVDRIINDFIIPANIQYTVRELEDRNWNEEWEKNYFEPIVIGNSCIIYSSFHHPQGEYRYHILIDPKMAFGTGHHQTTSLVLEQLLTMELLDKSVLDMGCGTGVLAILASMRGARRVTAIDIDDWAYENALENIRLNGIHSINVYQGGAELLGDETYEVILANINKNILLQDIPVYSSVLNKDGLLITSGFYEEDIPEILKICETNNLTFIGFSEKDHWVCMCCRKI